MLAIRDPDTTMPGSKIRPGLRDRIESGRSCDHRPVRIIGEVRRDRISVLERPCGEDMCAFVFCCRLPHGEHRLRIERNRRVILRDPNKVGRATVPTVVIGLRTLPYGKACQCRRPSNTGFAVGVEVENVPIEHEPGGDAQIALGIDLSL